jgi:hypothetical protein
MSITNDELKTILEKLGGNHPHELLIIATTVDFYSKAGRALNPIAHDFAVSTLTAMAAIFVESRGHSVQQLIAALKDIERAATTIDTINGL